MGTTGRGRLVAIIPQARDKSYLDLFVRTLGSNNGGENDCLQFTLPFDTAVFDRLGVKELHRALGLWLDDSDRGLPIIADEPK